MRVHPTIQVPPPAPRIHRYARASPDPIIFNLPEAGRVADAAWWAHNTSRAEPWAQLENWIHTAMRELGGYLEVNFHETFSRIDTIQRDVNQLQAVVTGISEEQTDFRQVVDTLRKNTFAMGDRIIPVNICMDDLGRRTTDVQCSLTAIEGQLTLQHHDMLGVQAGLRETQQGFNNMNTMLSNLQEEIIRDMQDTTTQKPPSMQSPSQSPDKFSLHDRPLSTPATIQTNPSGFSFSKAYKPEGYNPETQHQKQVSIAPVPEEDISIKPTFLGGINKEGDVDEPREEPTNRQNNNDDTIAEMESRFQKTLREEDKDKAKIAPPKYSGNQGDDANSWIVAMENYILYYPSKFQDEKRKIMVALNVLSDTNSTKLWVTPLMRKVLMNKQTLATRNWESFKDNFIQNFGDPAAHQNAFHKIKNLKQISSVADYATRFRIIAGDLRDPTDEMLSLFFIDGLKQSIRDHIWQVQTMDQRERTLEQWIAMAIQQDNFEQQNRQTYGGEKASINTPSKSNYTTTSNNTPGNNTPKRKFTATKYARSREGNLCIKCGKGPHKARNCKGTWIGPFQEEVKGKVATVEEETSSNTNTELEN